MFNPLQSKMTPFFTSKSYLLEATGKGESFQAPPQRTINSARFFIFLKDRGTKAAYTASSNKLSIYIGLFRT